MTRYETTRFYAARPPLDRLHDIRGLIASARDAVLSHPVLAACRHVDMARLDAVLVATVRVTCPDEAVLARAPAWMRAQAAADVNRRVARGLGERKLALAMSQPVDGGGIKDYYREVSVMGHVVSMDDPGPDEWGDTAGASAAAARITTVTTAASLSVYLIDALSVQALLDAVRFLLDHESIQYCSRVALEVRSKGSIQGLRVDGTVYSGVAAKVPASSRYWLVLARKDDVLRYLDTPGIADRIAAACAGMLVTADQAVKNGEPRKRRNVGKDGARAPMTIRAGGDVLALARDHDMLAFYPSIEAIDGSIGALVADLDQGQPFVAVLGAAGAWAATCRLASRLAIGMAELGLPPPLVLFSGSRGVHLYWRLDRDAILLDHDTGTVAVPGYMRAVRAVDPRVGQTRSSARLAGSILLASKVVLAGAVLKALHGYAYDGSVLTERQRAAIGIDEDTRVAVLDRQGWDHPRRVCIDVQPLVHRWLSPHHATGLVSRPICAPGWAEDPCMAIDPRYHDLATVRDGSTLDAVAALATSDPGSILLDAPVVDGAAFEALATSVAPDVVLLLWRGFTLAAGQGLDRYAYLRSWARDRLDAMDGTG